MQNPIPSAVRNRTYNLVLAAGSLAILAATILPELGVPASWQSLVSSIVGAVAIMGGILSKANLTVDDLGSAVSAGKTIAEDVEQIVAKAEHEHKSPVPAVSTVPTVVATDSTVAAPASVSVADPAAINVQTLADLQAAQAAAVAAPQPAASSATAATPTTVA